MKRLCVLVSLTLSFNLLGANSWSLCVTQNNTNLRASPSSKAAITWTVSKYTPLIEIKRASGWVQVQDMDGEIHWIGEKNVTTRMVCVMVQTRTTKLHRAPGSQGEVADIRLADRYTSFKRVDQKEQWSEVEASWGETYWIHENTLWRPLRVNKFNF